MHRPTLEIPIPASLVAATARPTRAPEPPTNLSLMAIAAIRDREFVAACRRNLATTASELQAVSQ